MKKLVFAAVVLSFAGLAAAGVVQQADKDNDGTLDRNEVKGHATLAKHFDAIDVDKDGTIDQAEIDAHAVMMGDKDNDGTVDKKEVKHKGVAKAFDQLDGDKDGTLDTKEVLAFFQKQK
jgi:Ca2+-binding EF-hand superfamily protein